MINIITSSDNKYIMKTEHIYKFNATTNQNILEGEGGGVGNNRENIKIFLCILKGGGGVNNRENTKTRAGLGEIIEKK